MEESYEPTGRDKIAIAIFVLTLIFCSEESVPQWSHIGLGWPRSTFLAIIAAAGGLAGLIVADVRWLGLITGPLCGVGAMLAQTTVLEGTNRTHTAILAIVAMIGILPGFGLYLLGKKLVARSDSSIPGPTDSST